jgi:hypothetical protein
LKSISPRSILDKNVLTGEFDWPQGQFPLPSSRPRRIITSAGRNLQGLD